LSLAMTMFQCRCKWRLINYKIMALYLHWGNETLHENVNAINTSTEKLLIAFGSS
jgi:hypothetical protein